jgi:hypothetical protein
MTPAGPSGRRMVEVRGAGAACAIAPDGSRAAFLLVAEADGNRTRLSRATAHTGFEDRGTHQDPDASNLTLPAQTWAASRGVVEMRASS